MKISKRQLRSIIKEEKAKLLSEQPEQPEQPEHEMYAADQELRKLGQAIEDLAGLANKVAVRMNKMSMKYGELSAVPTYTKRVTNTVEEVSTRFSTALSEMLKEY